MRNAKLEIIATLTWPSKEVGQRDANRRKIEQLVSRKPGLLFRPHTLRAYAAWLRCLMRSARLGKHTLSRWRLLYWGRGESRGSSKVY